MLNSLFAGTSIIYLDGTISVHYKVLEGFLTAMLKPTWNGSDLIPISHVALEVHMGNSFRRIPLQVIFSSSQRFEFLDVHRGEEANHHSQE